MFQFDSERKLKIGEIVITVKLISLIFLGMATFIEIPKLFVGKLSIFNNQFTTAEFAQNVTIFVLFGLSIWLIRYYQNRFIKDTYSSKKRILYDITETLLFICLDTFLVAFSGLNQSPFKSIFLFIMLSVTIQFGLRYGLIVSALSSFIIITIDVIAVPLRPNPFLQIDFMLFGAYFIITWLVGYYRSVEEQYSSRIENIAIKDDLTGLFSHGYFQRYLTEQIEAAQISKKPLSLLFIDIDYFKYFNELYGHQSGDEVLKLISEKIQNYVCAPHIAARYGGDEITVLMPNTTEEEAKHFAEKIRSEIEAENVNKFAEIKKITVSIGISCFPTTAKDKNELIKCADDALYRAKSLYKNRVETYQSVLEELKNEIDDDDIEIISSMKTFISIINTKDKYTYRHMERVVMYCGLIAEELNLSEEDRKALKYSAYLHDIGKINIDKHILNKKMPLTDEEWNIFKKHPGDGVDILRPVQSLSHVLPIILHHHEKFGGGGYPGNLAGKEIPYLARVLTVVDCFDAMTSNRPYSIAKSFNEGIQELIACSEKQFDPQIVKAFIKVVRRKRKLQHMEKIIS